jgi:hypothetical protein
MGSPGTPNAWQANIIIFVWIAAEKIYDEK